MPLPTIPDVFRCALNWDLGSRVSENVIHIFLADGTPADVFALVDACVDGGMFQSVSDDATIGSVDITALDGTPDGITFATDRTDKWKGQTAGQYVPQVAALVKHTTGGGGRSGRGRTYLPWTGESAQSDGTIESAQRGAITTGWTNFQTALTTATARLVIASYTQEDYRIVASSVCEVQSATQRRRQRR